MHELKRTFKNLSPARRVQKRERAIAAKSESVRRKRIVIVFTRSWSRCRRNLLFLDLRRLLRRYSRIFALLLSALSRFGVEASFEKFVAPSAFASADTAPESGIDPSQRPT